MLERLASIEKRYEELSRLMSSPEIASDPELVRKYAQEQVEIEELVQKYRRYKAITDELDATKSMLDEELGEEMQELVKEEVARLEGERERLLKEMKAMLLPKDPHDQRNVIMEIRAGAGGEEAALFAADLFRMYTRYAENHGWEIELLNLNETEMGGFKKAIFAVKGKGAYSRLKYESGVHRVQRVPITESSGRIHTSTATVAVLPEVDEVEVKVDPKDLRIDVYRSSGPGGQHMQKTSSAVRITHIPTGITASCESTRSQLHNKEKAMAILRARLYEREQRRQEAKIGKLRRSQVGTGERAEKIRTYNFPQNRVTDHRIDLSVYRLEDVLDGDLDEFIEKLADRDRMERLKALGIE